MPYNLDYVNYNRKRIGYFVHTQGVDREGNAVMLVVSKDPTASGCNPYYWRPARLNQPGYEFDDAAEAALQARHVGNNWSVASFDKEGITVTAIEITNQQTMTVVA